MEKGFHKYIYFIVLLPHIRTYHTKVAIELGIFDLTYDLVYGPYIVTRHRDLSY